MNNQVENSSDKGIQGNGLNTRLLVGVIIFLTLAAMNYSLVPDAFMDSYVENSARLVSEVANEHLGEQSRVLWDSQLGIKSVVKEDIGRETKVVYTSAYINYPVLFLFFAAVAIWAASIGSKLLTILIMTPVFFATEFALMVCAYLVEVHVPLWFDFYRSWIYPMFPVLICSLIFVIFTRASRKSKV